MKREEKLAIWWVIIGILILYLFNKILCEIV